MSVLFLAIHLIVSSRALSRHEGREKALVTDPPFMRTPGYQIKALPSDPFHLSYLLKGPISTVTLWVQASSHEFWGVIT